MAMKWFTKKATAIGVGVLMGVSASFVAMIPTSRNTEAAIAVIDEQNIAEAVKTAMQTAKILIETQKQFALMVQNLKKLDLNTLLQIAAQQDEQIASYVKQYETYKGVLSKVKNLDNLWDEMVGSYDSVLNGQLTVYDMYKITKNRAKQAQDTVNDANTIVLNAQKANQEALEQSKKIIEKSNEAEGELQALQSNTAAVVNETNVAVHQSDQLSALVSYAQMDRQDKEADRAYSQAIANESAQVAKKYATYDNRKNLYKER